MTDFTRDEEPIGPPDPPFGRAFAVAIPTAWAWSGLVGSLAMHLKVETFLVFPLAVGVLGLGFVALAGARVTRGAMLRLAEVTLFAVLPLWGAALDLASPACSGCEESRPVAWPGLLVIYAAYGAGLGAWVAHRWRPAPWSVFGEGLLATGLALGVVCTGALAVQFAPLMLQGVVFAPFGLPLAAPPVCAALFAFALLQRARRAWPVFGGAMVTTAGLLGADALAHVALTGRPGLWGGALTQTCGWTLSTLVPPETDCHYLCTVAAQGHPWLVRPVRMGSRRGRPIVVNRQLAVANAFEDLLHERWPRTGRFLRRTYDRLAFPVSRWLLNPLAADAVFVAMLPAQLGFEVFLRLFDRAPEARIDRMYRPAPALPPPAGSDRAVDS